MQSQVGQGQCDLTYVAARMLSKGQTYGRPALVRCTMIRLVLWHVCRTAVLTCLSERCKRSLCAGREACKPSSALLAE